MNFKMARPHLTLDKWLSTDTDLKKDFLDQESYMKESLLTKLDKPGQKSVYISTNHGEFKHEVRQFQKPYDNQQAEQTSLMV